MSNMESRMNSAELDYAFKQWKYGEAALVSPDGINSPTVFVPILNSFLYPNADKVAVLTDANVHYYEKEDSSDLIITSGSFGAGPVRTIAVLELPSHNIKLRGFYFADRAPHPVRWSAAWDLYRIDEPKENSGFAQRLGRAFRVI